MKRLSFALVAVLALFANACEKHPAPAPGDDGHGSHDSHAPAAHAPADAHGAAAKHEEKKEEHAAPADAPKFFPEKK